MCFLNLHCSVFLHLCCELLSYELFVYHSQVKTILQQMELCFHLAELLKLKCREKGSKTIIVHHR